MKNKIAEMRNKAGLTQNQLVELSGIPRRTLQLWETNQTTPDMFKAYQIAKVLECSIEDLINFEDEEKPE